MGAKGVSSVMGIGRLSRSGEARGRPGAVMEDWTRLQPGRVYAAGGGGSTALYRRDPLAPCWISPRRASFTEAVSEKTSATSGSRTISVLPSENRPAYLPTTPLLKSYSSRISESCSSLQTLLILGTLPLFKIRTGSRY